MEPMTDERLEEIKERHRKCTKLHDFSEWNTMAYGDRDELLEEVDRLREELEKAKEEIAACHFNRGELFEENLRLKEELAKAKRETAEEIAASLEEEDASHTEYIGAGFQSCRVIATRVLKGENSLWNMAEFEAVLQGEKP